MTYGCHQTGHQYQSEGVWDNGSWHSPDHQVVGLAVVDHQVVADQVVEDHRAEGHQEGRQGHQKVQGQQHQMTMTRLLVLC